MEIAVILKKISSILIIPVVVIGVLLYQTHRMNRKSKLLSEEYLLIKKKDSIYDVVVSIYFPDGFKSVPSTRLIVLSNIGKRTLYTDKDDACKSIGDVIQVGTLISKQKDNDTVVLKNIKASDTSVYYFRILDPDFR
ncbi:MAG: hypothetical protein JNL22_14830 [Bacteroidales bacterium]|nr:hypothetical protein [Bacteroidales bacterium]